MESNRVRAAVGVALVALAVVLFVVLKGGDDDGDKPAPAPGQTQTAGGNPAPKPQITTIALKGGEPVGGVENLDFSSGERVRFRVTSDIEGEVHVHGYEIEKPIEAGGSVSFDFPARLEGGYEVELHHGGGETQIAELKIQPG
jgi:hypothetical protein